MTGRDRLAIGFCTVVGICIWIYVLWPQPGKDPAKLELPCFECEQALAVADSVIADWRVRMLAYEAALESKGMLVVVDQLSVERVRTGVTPAGDTMKAVFHLEKLRPPKLEAWLVLDHDADSVVCGATGQMDALLMADHLGKGVLLGHALQVVRAEWEKP